MECVMQNIQKIIKLRSIQLLAALLIMSLIVFKLLAPSTSGLKTPIEAQLHALQIEDLVTAYSFTSRAFQKSTSLDSFKRFVRDYSGLRNNESIAFNSSAVKNGIGVVKGTLISRAGSNTAVTYQLVKEHNKWKIESMVIIPNGDERPADDVPAVKPVATSDAIPTPAPTAATTDTASAPAAETNTPSTAVALAPNVYEDATDNYTLHYPTGWEYAKTDEGMLVFHKIDSNADNQTLLSITPLVSDDSARFSVQQIADKSEESIKSKAGSYKIVEDGLLPPGANKNENIHGRFTVYSYTLDNDTTFKQLQVIYFKSPSRAKYIIDYVSPEAEFDADLPAVRAMIASFTIPS